jgi:hypothetical protein
VAGVGFILFGLIWLGKVAGRRLRETERLTVAFADIECTPPPGQTRADFLEQVQYWAAMPDKLSFRDEDLAERLAGAFARHPRVEKVRQVKMLAPRRILVQLVFRRPVLAVPWAGQVRVVDGTGVLLPKGTSARGLPLFQGHASAPKNSEGKPWGDAAVEAAAHRAAQKLTSNRQGAK